jgi:Fic family protein
MDKLKLARQQFKNHLEEKISENKQTIQILQSGHHFNARQLRLLHYLSKDEQHHTTLAAYHADNTDVVYATAFNDLKKLVDEGFLRKGKMGRNVYYYPTQKIHTIIR